MALTMRLWPGNYNKGRGLIEILFSITVLLIVSSIFAGYWIINLREAREVALRNQLTNLKTSLELYCILEKGYPEELKGLNKRYRVIGKDTLFDKEYLELQTLDEEGYPVDPYGRRFLYDSNTGKIKRRRQ